MRRSFRFRTLGAPLLAAAVYAVAAVVLLVATARLDVRLGAFALLFGSPPLAWWALRARLRGVVRAREARFASLVEAFPDMVFLLDREEHVLYLNAAAARTLGGRPEEFVGRDQADLFPAATGRQHSLSLAEIFRTGESFRSEAPHEMGGRTIWIETHLAPILDAHATVRSVLGVARDITERRHAEAELRTAYQHTSDILEATSDGFLSLDSGSVLRSFNQAAERMLGRSRADVLGRTLIEAFPELRGSAFEEKFTQSRREGKPVAFETYFAAKPYENWYEVRVFPIQDGLSVFFKVTTDRKRLEEQLMQAQKMEAIGRLAGGVAHDFNNQLAAILGYGELVLKDLPVDHPARPRAEQIRKAAERAATLTRQLLAFGRRQVLEPELLNLSTVVSDLEEMLRRTIGEDIELKIALAPDLARVRADRAQVEQALLHLVVNARDAMPRGGSLTIETRGAELDAAYCRRHLDARPGPHAVLAVADTGCGMDGVTLDRLFEPFFTTKEIGRGTGLGLSMVYGFVTQSGGHVAVESEVGRGSRFMIYLPCVGGAQAPAVRAASATAPSPRGNETVLVVEDEPVVRRLIVDVLRASGYRVIEASDGEEGRKAAEAHDGEIALLLTDIVMPRMGGQALAALLVRSRPGLNVLFMSGHAEDAINPQGAVDPSRLLQKPFTPTALVRRVREALNGAVVPDAQGG
jgi:two-component system cell cycle sensor histidine kinase/response regulator CckA